MGHRLNINDTVVVSISTQRNELFSFSRSDNKTKSGVEVALYAMDGKWRVECLSTQFYPLTLQYAVYRRAKKSKILDEFAL